MSTFNHTLYDAETETEQVIKVEYTYYPGCRGTRDKYGAPETPDDEPEVDILSVLNVAGDDILDQLEKLGQEDEIIDAALANAGHRSLSLYR